MLSLARLRGQYLAPVTMIRLVPISVVLLGGIALTTWTSGLLSRHRDLVVHIRAAVAFYITRKSLNSKTV